MEKRPLIYVSSGKIIVSDKFEELNLPSIVLPPFLDLLHLLFNSKTDITSSGLCNTSSPLRKQELGWRSYLLISKNEHRVLPVSNWVY